MESAETLDYENLVEFLCQKEKGETSRGQLGWGQGDGKEEKYLMPIH